MSLSEANRGGQAVGGLMTTLLRKSLNEIRRFRRRNRHLVARLHGKRYVNILHIRKTGGTALKHAVQHCPVTETCYIEFHRHWVTLRHVPRGETVVFFVRDPVSRFVSGFNCRMRQGLPRHMSPWHPDEELAFRHFHTANELGLAISSQDNEVRQKALQAMRAINHVNSSYWDWFESEAYFLSRINDLLFIGFQERLADDFAILKEKLSLPATVLLPADDVAAHRAPSHQSKQLDPEAVANIKKWYARDYEFLRLCEQIAGQLRKAA